MVELIHQLVTVMMYVRINNSSVHGTFQTFRHQPLSAPIDVHSELNKMFIAMCEEFIHSEVKKLRGLH